MTTTRLPPHLPIKYGFDLSSPPKVPDADQNEGVFYPSHDQRLFMFYRLWEPAKNQDVVAMLIIVHGTVDHSGVYRELGKELTKAGIAVIAMDMRGWGMSDGESMYFHDVDTFVEDVKYISDMICSMSRFKNVKLRFILGKSLGGLVTAYAAAKYPNEWTGLIGLSGGYQVDEEHVPPSLVVSILSLLAMVKPKMFLKKAFDENLIVSDVNALDAWRKDALCSKDKIRLGYGVEFLRACEELENSVAAKLNLPMLMMIGDADRVVTLHGHEMMIQLNQHEDTRLIVYPGGYHNILQEPSLKDSVMADIREWILQHS